MTNIKQNYHNLLQEVQTINPHAQFCVVTKNQTLAKVLEVIQTGAKIIGENRVQEAESKFSQIPAFVKKHLIGHLQRNKVKKAVQLFDLIQSVDNLRLAKKIDQECQEIDKIMPIFLEVNISKESQKHGFLLEELLENIQKIKKLKNIKIMGLMAIAKFEENPENCRSDFQKLQNTFQNLQKKFPDLELKNLSMGMTNDYKIALEEGGNLVRIGRGVFK